MYFSAKTCAKTKDYQTPDRYFTSDGADKKPETLEEAPLEQTLLTVSRLEILKFYSLRHCLQEFLERCKPYHSQKWKLECKISENWRQSS